MVGRGCRPKSSRGTDALAGLVAAGLGILKAFKQVSASAAAELGMPLLSLLC